MKLCRTRIDASHRLCNIQDFTCHLLSVVVSATQVMQFMAWKAGMDIAVRHILQKDLPPYVRGSDAAPLAAPPAEPPAAAAPAPTADAAAPPAGAAGAPAVPPAAAAAQLSRPGAAGSEAGAPAGPGARGEASGALANGSDKAPVGAGEAGQRGASGAAPAAGVKRPRDDGVGAGADRGQGLQPNSGTQAAEGLAGAGLPAERAPRARRLNNGQGEPGTDAVQAAAPAAAPAEGGAAPNTKAGRVIAAAKPARGDSEDGETTSRARSELALDDLGSAQARIAACRHCLCCGSREATDAACHSGGGLATRPPVRCMQFLTTSRECARQPAAFDACALPDRGGSSGEHGVGGEHRQHRRGGRRTSRGGRG